MVFGYLVKSLEAALDSKKTMSLKEKRSVGICTERDGNFARRYYVIRT